MDKLVHTAEDGKIKEVSEILQKQTDNSEIVETVEKQLLRGKGDAVALIRTVLQASSDTSGSKRCVELYKMCVKVLEKNELPNKMASALVGMLMIETDVLNGPALAEISSLFIDMVKNGSIQCGKGLELLPKILSAISVEETVCYGENSLKGEEYKNQVVNSLCSCKWNSASVLHLAAMFKDASLTNEELKFVLEKIIRMMKELELADLPALVYQLLLLSTKGYKKLVIEGVTNYFMEQDTVYKDHNPNEFSEDLLEGDNTSVETLRQIEGTIILHINFAIKQDQELGREFIKFLKSNQQCNASKVLAPFVLALSLSLSRIHRFEDQIFDLLKATILKSFKDSEKQQQSQWVREIVPDKCDIQEYVMSTIQNSTYGWDHVIQGLVNLGFILMDSFGPKGVFGRIEVGSVQSGPTHSACQLGRKVLISTFKAHEMVRAEILEQIFNRVVTKATSPVSHYLELLSSTVMSAPQILLESSTKIREMFDYLAFLSPSSAEELLKAIQPLLKLSMSLRDSLILVLRKAMFSRQLDSRKIGVHGFLMFLKHFRILGGLPSSQASQSFSSSQVQVDIHARYNPASNEALCLEIMGNLRRVLTQQADVRLLFYQGIYEALCRNTQILGSILEILLNQIKKYYESSEDVNPPVKLELCISAQGDQIYLAEPLAHLVCCIQLCLIKVSEIRRHHHDNDDSLIADSAHSQQELEDIMESLVQRMIKSEMEDFELDKSADFSLVNGVGIKNNIFAILVLGMYESLIEYTFHTGQHSESSIQQMLGLFENYKKLSEVLKEKSNAAAGKKGKTPTGNKTALSLISLRGVTYILKALISDTAPSEEKNLSVLRENLDFRKHIVTVALQKIQQVQDKGSCDGAEGGDKNKVLEYLIHLSKIFVTYYTENQKPEEDGKRDRAKNISGQCLEGLMGIMTIISQRYSDRFSHCLCEMVGADEKEDRQEVIYTHIKKYQRLVMNILRSDNEDKNMKEVPLLLGIIQLLCKQLYSTGNQHEKVLEWIHKLCTEQNIDDIATCKLLFSLLLDFNQQIKSCPPLLRDLSQDIHSQLGDIDQEVEVEDKTHFALVTQRTAAPVVITLVLQHVEKELDDTEWVISRIKSDMAASQDEGPEVDLTQREGHEKSICTRLGILVTAFHELTQSAIPVGNCMENIVKQSTRLYGTLTALVKFLYQQRTGHMSSRFEKLVKLIGTHLTQYCYGMITYIQQTESEQVQQNVDKGKKDKKKQMAALNAGKAKVMKESRTIPNLIFSIETFEKFLIQLSKKSKVNLMEHMKLSTSRDFRINIATVQAVMENEDDTDEEDDDEDNDKEDEASQQNQNDSSTEEQENTAPSNKRRAEAENFPPAKKSKLGTKNRKGKV